MNYVPRISRQQFFVIFAIANICLTPFGFPALILKQLDHHAWLSPTIAFLLSIWNVFVAISLARQFPEHNIVEWSSQVLGKWLGALFSILFIIVMYFWGISMVWVLWHLVMFTQLPYTPIFLPTLIIVGGVVYLLRQGLESFARFAEVMIVLIFIGLIAVNSVQFINADFGRLLPFGNIKYENLVNADTIASLFVFRGIFIIFFLYKYLNEKKRMFMLSLGSLSIAFIEIALSVILPIAIFGAHGAKILTYPYQEAISSVSIRWFPFEKLTFITPMLWQIIIVYVLGSSLFCTTEGLAHLFKIKSKKRLLLIVGLLTWVIVLYQIPTSQLAEWMKIWSLAGLVVLTVIPSFMWLGLLIRRRLKS